MDQYSNITGYGSTLYKKMLYQLGIHKTSYHAHFVDKINCSSYTHNSLWYKQHSFYICITCEPLASVGKLIQAALRCRDECIAILQCLTFLAGNQPNASASIYINSKVSVMYIYFMCMHSTLYIMLGLQLLKTWNGIAVQYPRTTTLSQLHEQCSLLFQT